METPPTGQLIARDALVASVLAPNPSPFTFTGTQTHLVGRDTLAVIDPGPDDDRHLAALLAAIDGRPVAAIVVTHTHRDHSPLANRLKTATGAPIVGAAPIDLAALPSEVRVSFDADYSPDRVLADGETIVSPEWTLEAIATPGHASNHLAFALNGTGVLFPGDHVMGWSTSVVAPPDGDMGAYMASLETLRARDDRIYYPAHGEPIADPQRLLRGMLGHRKQREGQILRLLDGGAATLPAMAERMYVGLDPRLAKAAEGSVLAHLIDLERRGLTVCDASLWRRAA